MSNAREIFDQLLADVSVGAESHRVRGIVIVSATFPTVVVAFCAPRLDPPAVVFGARIDLSGLPDEPPSHVLVDPFTNRPYALEEVPVSFRHAAPSDPAVPDGFPVPPDATDAQFYEYASLLHSTADNNLYVALPGVEETQDAAGEADQASGGAHSDISLTDLLHALHRYGADPIVGYRFRPQDGRFIGFLQDRVPLPRGHLNVRVPFLARTAEPLPAP